VKMPRASSRAFLKKKPFWPFMPSLLGRALPSGGHPISGRAMWLFHVIKPQKNFWSPRREKTCLMRAFVPGGPTQPFP